MYLNHSVHYHADTGSNFKFVSKTKYINKCTNVHKKILNELNCVQLTLHVRCNLWFIK